MARKTAPLTPAWEQTLDTICELTARRIVAGDSFADYRCWLTGMIPHLLDSAGIPRAEQAPEMLRGVATAAALEFWNATPHPDNRFRPRKIARPERNAPCLCGSGRKFKQCCGATNPPDLGIGEELMLSYVLDQFPQKSLSSLPLKDLHPEALGLVASRWLEAGQPKRAIALLERLFADLEHLDGRAEFPADMLLTAYLEIHAPRKKQAFIDALKAAPDKLLRSTGWQRQATVYCDKGKLPQAWEAFREAQRLTPNEPALSHLEVLMLVSEGRRDEAKARAEFWAARLARDSKYDHSDLIETLHRLADGSDESLLGTVSLGIGPLPLLAKAEASWPEPVCHYSLKHGEVTPKKALLDLEDHWQQLLVDEEDPESALLLLEEEPLAGHSFRILRDLVELLPGMPEGLPGSADALARKLLERAEALRLVVLGKLKALDQELAWGWLDNRPLLTLTGYYIEEFSGNRPEQTLELLRWCVNTANPTDNQGLRAILIHRLVAAGLGDEALGVAERYPDDFASTEYGRVLAYFVAGRLPEAEASLHLAQARHPKVWKMLHAAKPRRPRSTNPGYITVGGDDEAWVYRDQHLDLWRSTGALKWSVGIKPAAAPKAAKSPPSPDDSGQEPLF